MSVAKVTDGTGSTTDRYGNKIVEPANRVAVFISNVGNRPIRLLAGRTVALAMEADSSPLPPIPPVAVPVVQETHHVTAVRCDGREIVGNTSDLFGSCDGSVGSDNDSHIWMDDHLGSKVVGSEQSTDPLDKVTYPTDPIRRSRVRKLCEKYRHLFITTNAELKLSPLITHNVDTGDAKPLK